MGEDTEMKFHYDKILEQKLVPLTEGTEGPPAWLVICLAKSLRDWFGEPHRASYQSGSTQLQFGYEILSVPILEFAQSFGLLIAEIDRTWPIQVFGVADNGELVELSFTKMDQMLGVKQYNISGVWCEDLRGLYLCLELPDPCSANCMSRLLHAVGEGEDATALEWDYADFLEQQGISQIDRTLSFCYVPLDTDLEGGVSLAYLSGLTPEQKNTLWRLFLERHLLPPEFEWLRDALLKNCVPNWIEWHLELYRVLEQLHIRFLYSGNQFELLDREGKRLYFGVDHPNAAEQVLMKILFPLNQ